MKQYARASSSGTAANGPLRRLRPALGTFVEVTAQMAPGGDARTWQRSEVLQGLITQAFSGIANLEGVFSCFTPASELYRVNHAPVGEWIEISGELAEVLGFGARLEQASDGAFRMMAEREYELAGEGARSRRPPGATAFRRVRRTSELGFDLGGLAKGYIVDAAFARLVEARPDVHWVVNAGGDLRSSHPFRAAVRVPTGAEEFEYDFMLPACALATSSRETSLNRKPTARYLPRRDPSRPSYTSRAIFADTSAASRWDPAPVGPNTVCVMAENCLTADALTKVGLFRGTGDVPGFPVFQMAAFASNGAVIGDGRANGA